MNRDPIGQLVSGYETYGASGAVLVEHKGELLIHKGFGWADHDGERRCTTRTVFDIGSISKQFTATAIMLLEDEGLLTTETSIAEFLPDIPEDRNAITLHDLLVHRSGVSVYHGDDFEVISIEEAVERIMSAPLRRPAGNAFEYSNSGYTLLAAVVEVVSGVPFMAFLHNRLFAPAGLRSTGFYRDKRLLASEMARGYDGLAGNIDAGSPAEWAGPSFTVVGNGGILSTVGDLWRWERCLSAGGLLSPEARRKLFARHTDEYGYGWRVDESPTGSPRIRHGGSNDIFSATFARYPEEGSVVIVMANRSIDGCMLAQPIAENLEATLFLGAPGSIPPVGERLEPPVEGSWAADRGSLVFYARSGVVHVTGYGEIGALISGIDADSLGRAQELGSLAEEIVRLALSNGSDESPGAMDLIYTDDVPVDLEDMDKLAAEVRPAALEITEDLGPVKKVVSLGTFRVGPFDSHEAWVTYVRVFDDSDDFRTLRLVWFDAELLDMVLIGERDPLELVVRRAGRGRLMTWNPMTGHSVEFVMSDDRQISIDDVELFEAGPQTLVHDVVGRAG